MLASEIFKANDIRGIVGTGWDAAGARALGQAYARLVPQRRIVVGRDMRVTSPKMQAAFIRGVTESGVSVVDIGLASTDTVWFASGRLDLPGVQVTSSHNPSEYNGLKFCVEGAKPVTTGFLTALAKLAMKLDSAGLTPVGAVEGSVEYVDVLEDYVSYLLSLVDLGDLSKAPVATGDGSSCHRGRFQLPPGTVPVATGDGSRRSADAVRSPAGHRLKVVVDAGNGMAGHTVPRVFAHLDVDLVGLYLDLDGTFPNHQPNPLEPANLVAIQEAVRKTGADLGIAFDGDADRAFVIDETGAVVSPSAVTAMIAAGELAAEPGATIIVNTITSSAVREIVAELGGQVVVSKVGHTYMKAEMAAHNAVFGGEHSAHYYFRDFFGADTGMLAALFVLAAVRAADQPLSHLTRQYTRYAESGEINLEVADVQAAMDLVASRLGWVTRTVPVSTGTVTTGTVTWDDGLMITGDNWWVSLRPSNTEPLLRLNVEARDAALMARLRDDVLNLLKEE